MGRGSICCIPIVKHIEFSIEFPLWKRGLLPLNDPTSIQFQTIEHNFDQTVWAGGGTQTNMCTFFEKNVRLGYVVQNMLQILFANFKPFLTKTGLLRAI